VALESRNTLERGRCERLLAEFDAL
jgi:hypothetical protein